MINELTAEIKRIYDHGQALHDRWPQIVKFSPAPPPKDVDINQIARLVFIGGHYIDFWIRDGSLKLRVTGFNEPKEFPLSDPTYTGYSP